MLILRHLQLSGRKSCAPAALGPSVVDLRRHPTARAHRTLWPITDDVTGRTTKTTDLYAGPHGFTAKSLWEPPLCRTVAWVGARPIGFTDRFTLPYGSTYGSNIEKDQCLPRS